MCKNLDGENWRIFGQSSILPNFSGTKVSLHMLCTHELWTKMLLHPVLPKVMVTLATYLKSRRDFTMVSLHIMTNPHYLEEVSSPLPHHPYTDGCIMKLFYERQLQLFLSKSYYCWAVFWKDQLNFDLYKTINL